MKQFHVKIYFDKIENNRFGALQHQSMTLLIPEDVKDELLRQHLAGNSVVTVTLSETQKRHINTSSILYMDVSEVLEANNEEK